jgi:hypothetical protein
MENFSTGSQRNTDSPPPIPLKKARFDEIHAQSNIAVGDVLLSVLRFEDTTTILELPDELLVCIYFINLFQ